MQCIYIKENDGQCEANAVSNSEYCFSHSPEHEEQKALAVKRGGLNRKLYQVYGERIEIQTPKDIQTLLAETINLVRTGEMPASQPANSIAYLARCWLDAHEASEMEARLEAIEEKLKQANL